MPRIAAALGGFALIAFSIGLNMARYPRVWEMVGPPSPLSQSSESSQSEAVAKPASASHSEAAAPSTVSRQSIPAAPPASSAKYASGAVGADSLVRLASGKPLVPLIRPDRRGDASVQSGFAPEVARLPPVDRPGRFATDPYARRSPGGPIPIYPTTGVE